MRGRTRTTTAIAVDSPSSAFSSAVAPVEPADPEDFPAFHPRAPDAYISFNSVNRLLERGDVALVRSEFFLDRDSPIPARQNLDSTFVFGGPLELKLQECICEVGLMTVVAISYTWNQTWQDGECVEAHPDPSMYFLGVVQKVLRFMLKTKEYKKTRAYLFWVSVVPPQIRKSS